MMRYKFVTLLFLLFSPVLLQAADGGKAVEKFVKTNGIRPESVSVKITDLRDGKVIAEHNARSPLVPASIMKSVTTAALLEKGGMDFRFHTGIAIDGPLDMGILRGNLVVIGGGDPSLNSAVEPFGEDVIREIIAALRQAGIHRIEGKIVVDESWLSGPGRPASWAPADFKESYGTASHCFNFENNASGRRSVENPKRIFESRLMSALRREGIIIDNRELGEGRLQPIADHVSPPIDEIMRSCMMRSDNLFAEAMLRAYGKLEGGDGSTADAANREYEHWKKKRVPLEGVRIIDGSGLSRDNRVTADFMTGVLTGMSGDENYASFFPLAGQEGTLKRFLAGTPLDSYIAMKTGSMKGIQCYAGYLLDENYKPTHSVVIMMNDITRSRDRAKKAAERMLLEVFDIPAELENESITEENE